MDGELKNLKCNISQLAAITGLHRQTVVSRLSGVPLAPGSNEKNKLYLLTDVIRVLMETPVSQPAEHQDPYKMTAKERKGWFDSEKGRLWLEKEMKQVVPLPEVRQQMAAIVKAITQVLEVWPDKLEKDKGWSADQLNEAQDVMDEVRILLLRQYRRPQTMTGNKYGSAAAVRREVAEYLRPPRRMPVAEGIKQFMFVPRGANTAVPWDDTLASQSFPK